MTITQRAVKINYVRIFHSCHKIDNIAAAANAKCQAVKIPFTLVMTTGLGDTDSNTDTAWVGYLEEKGNRGIKCRADGRHAEKTNGSHERLVYQS